MSTQTNELSLSDRIEHHRRMAESYRNTYLRQSVQEGEQYDAWTFTPGATYSSPYFLGDGTITLGAFSENAARAATTEAKAYSLTFPDWKPASFAYWPAENGVAMKTRWEGTREDGVRMGFYSYSFIETNAKGEITHWETHVNDEYGPFIEAAIGVRGPFKGDEYMTAVSRALADNGITETG